MLKCPHGWQSCCVCALFVVFWPLPFKSLCTPLEWHDSGFLFYSLQIKSEKPPEFIVLTPLHDEWLLLSEPQHSSDQCDRVRAWRGVWSHTSWLEEVEEGGSGWRRVRFPCPGGLWGVVVADVTSVPGLPPSLHLCATSLLPRSHVFLCCRSTDSNPSLNLKIPTGAGSHWTGTTITSRIWISALMPQTLFGFGNYFFWISETL